MHPIRFERNYLTQHVPSMGTGKDSEQFKLVGVTGLEPARSYDTWFQARMASIYPTTLRLKIGAGKGFEPDVCQFHFRHHIETSTDIKWSAQVDFSLIRCLGRLL